MNNFHLLYTDRMKLRGTPSCYIFSRHNLDFAFLKALARSPVVEISPYLVSSPLEVAAVHSSLNGYWNHLTVDQMSQP